MPLFQCVAHSPRCIDLLFASLCRVRAAYAADVEQVSATKTLLDKMQRAMDAMEAERNEWKDAYNDVKEKRMQRDELVEKLMEQLRTLESTTRAEELRASEEARRAALLQKEKELVLEKLSRTSSDLDAAYTRLASVNDELSAQRETAEGLDHTVQSLTAWRSAKDNQVAALVREKTRLFRLVADLRSTIRGAGGALAKATAAEEAAEEAAAVAAAAVSPSGGSVAAASAHKRSASKSRPSTARDVHALIAGTLSGTLDRPAWSGRRSATARSSSGAAVPPLSTPEALDRLSFEGHLASLALRSGGSASGAQSARSGTSAPGSARSTTGGKPKAEQSHSRGDSLRDLDSSSSDSEEEPSSRSSRAHSRSHSRSHSQSQSGGGAGSAQAAAKQNLVLRLKKHIELLEEKNKELEKVHIAACHLAAPGEGVWAKEAGRQSCSVESDAHLACHFFVFVLFLRPVSSHGSQ